MRFIDEQSLVRYANNLIMRFGRFLPVALYCGDGFEFFEALCKGKPTSPETELLLEIEKVVSEMNNLNLGGIVGLCLEKQEDYENCAFLQTMPVSRIVDTTIFRGGHRHLVQLATPVVVAAMYDILKTEAIMATGHSRRYVPKPAMVNFVKSHRVEKAV